MAALSGLATQTYFDGDGLLRKYGPDKATATPGGEYKTFGNYREIEINLDLTLLTTTNKIVSDQVFFPKNVRIEEVEIMTTTAAATSTSALLNFGLVKASDRETEVSFNGILAAATTAQMTGGLLTRIAKGGTSAGSLLGSGSVASTVPCHFTAATTTGTYSAGVTRIKVRYLV